MTSPKDGGKAARDWTALSARQRDLLRKAFDADQAAAEAPRTPACPRPPDRLQDPVARDHGRLGCMAVDRHRPAPAGGSGPATPTAPTTRRCGTPGSSSSTSAPGSGADAGRTRRRPGPESAGAPPPDRPPRGLLSRSVGMGRALAELYAAGDGGLVIWALLPGAVSLAEWEKCPSWGTILRLKNRSAPYAEEFKTEGGRMVRAALTAAGAQASTLDANRGHYTARYPDVDVPGPDHPVTRHRADPAQMTRDARHRGTAFFELAEAKPWPTRRSGNPDEAARIGTQADAYRTALRVRSHLAQPDHGRRPADCAGLASSGG